MTTLAIQEKGSFFFLSKQGLDKSKTDFCYLLQDCSGIRTHGLTLYPETILMPTTFTIVQAAKPAISDNFTSSQVSMNVYEMSTMSKIMS